jgi:hypothetical protein
MDRGYVDFERLFTLNMAGGLWANNYKQLPPGERLAILAAILEVEGRPA